MKKNKLVRITTVPISFKLLLPGQLKFMHEKGFLVTAVSSPDKILTEFKLTEGVEIKSITFTRNITPLQDLKSLFRLIKFLLKFKPDIVHTHTPKAGLLGMLAACLCKVPTRLHTVAGLPQIEATGVKRRILDFTEKTTYACAHRIYPNSIKLKETILKNRYCPPEKIKVIGNGSSNGINTDYFSPIHFDQEFKLEMLRNYNLSANDTILCFIGRVVKDKGINELIKAFASISDKNPTLKLFVVGWFEKELGELDENIEKILLNHRNIIFTGYQNDVRPFLAISDLFVFPSYREGFPNVVMQAGAMGVPSIVSNINGCNEIVQDGINGTIIPVKNSSALEKAINELISNKALLKRMASKSRGMIVKRYNQQLFWQELLKEYNHFL